MSKKSRQVDGSVIADRFETEEAFLSLLTSAEPNTKNDGQKAFVEKIKARHARYGTQAFLTKAQKTRLERIVTGKHN